MRRNCLFLCRLLLAVILLLTIKSNGIAAVNFADYFPLDNSIRIYITTRGDQEDLGKTYVNRVIGTEQIGTTLTTKVGVFPTVEANAPDTYSSYVNVTNNGTSVKMWANETSIFNPPLERGILNDVDIVPAFS